MTSPTDPSRADNARQGPPEPGPAPDSTARPAASLTPYTTTCAVPASTGFGVDDYSGLYVSADDCARLEQSHAALVAELENCQRVFLAWTQDEDPHGDLQPGESPALDAAWDRYNAVTQALTAARALLEAGR